MTVTAGVDEAEIRRRVGVLDLGGTYGTMFVEMVETIRAVSDVFDNGLPGQRYIELAQPIVHFDEDCRRYDEVFTDVVDQSDTELVLGVCCVEEGRDRPCVEDESQKLRRAAGSSGGRALVGRDRARRCSVATDDSEPGSNAAPWAPGFVLGRFSEDLRERDAPASRLAFKHGEVVALGSYGRPSDRHASDARIVACVDAKGPGANAGSDLDFLVIEQEVVSRAAESARLRGILPRLDVPVDVIVLTEDQARERAQVRGSAVARALAEGRVVAQS